ncbi:hypothetical protein chiPu_0004777 [Chiloscyllium punctatum]|uniref:Uncharacterized protein n=1 Tax=Chiloscyllium punctatum TaxID=137246 RepID=A0A401S7K6_CHIPU|nr:hypothetical protein [Chiloscyllium punctatum]
MIRFAPPQTPLGARTELRHSPRRCLYRAPGAVSPPTAPHRRFRTCPQPFTVRAARERQGKPGMGENRELGKPGIGEKPGTEETGNGGNREWGETGNGGNRERGETGDGEN